MSEKSSQNPCGRGLYFIFANGQNLLTLICRERLCFFSEKYMMAVIVGTIGGVAVIAFIIAAVRYVGHNNKK